MEQRRRLHSLVFIDKIIIKKIAEKLSNKIKCRTDAVHNLNLKFSSLITSPQYHKNIRKELYLQCLQALELIFL